MKPIVWCGDSRSRLSEFPEAARRAAGHELNRIQHGRDPTDWKPMPTVGQGVNEIRVHAGGEHRVLYIAKFEEAVFVLHAFGKKTRQTPGKAIELAHSRLRAVLEQRRMQKR